MQTNQRCTRAPGLAAKLGRSALLAAGLAVFSLPQAAFAADSYMPADPEPGTDIPSATIKFGMRPYADNTFYIIGMKQGWFEEVGISFDPAPYGLKANDSNVLTLMLNGQLDIISEYCPLILPTYTDSRLLKCIAFTDSNTAFSILANPDLKLKTLKEYMAEGKSFDEAIKATLSPLEGETLVIPPQLSTRPFLEALASMSGVKWNSQVLDDSKSMVLAKAGREKFAIFEGAPITYTMRKAGWTDLVDIGDLVKFAPSDQASDLSNIMNIVGIAGNADYVNSHQNTVLRFLSVVWRIFDATAKDESLYDLQAPYLNSFAGTDLDGAGVADAIKVLDPFTPFDENGQYYDDPAAITYFGNVWGAIIAGLEENKLLPEGTVKPEEVVWGGPIWHQMVDYKSKSEELFSKLDAMTLADDKKALVEKAKSFYDAFDFLDSYRLALAASS